MYKGDYSATEACDNLEGTMLIENMTCYAMPLCLANALRNSVQFTFALVVYALPTGITACEWKILWWGSAARLPHVTQSNLRYGFTLK